MPHSFSLFSLSFDSWASVGDHCKGAQQWQDTLTALPLSSSRWCETAKMTAEILKGLQVQAVPTEISRCSVYIEIVTPIFKRKNSQLKGKGTKFDIVWMTVWLQTHPNHRSVWLRRVDVGCSLPEKCKTRTATRAKTERLRPTNQTSFSSFLWVRAARRTLR